MTLAETIIRKCERSSRDWKKGESGNRTYYIQQEDYDAIGRKALFEEVETLKREGILTEVRWYQTGIELEWVTEGKVPSYFVLVGGLLKK